MNYFLSLFLIFLIPSKTDINNQTEHQAVLQSIFNIEEFQNYIATSPRFIGTNTKQNVLMMGFPELEDNKQIELKIRDRSVKIISEKAIDEQEHNFFIRIDEFELKKSKAAVLLSYQNAKMYYEKEQKVLLDAQLQKTDNNEWEVEHYKLYEVNINTSD